jgi:predicted transcriptional regulator
MALVSPSNTVTVKLNLSEETANNLSKYADWAKATRSKVVRVALDRLFEDDDAWKKFLEDEL